MAKLQKALISAFIAIHITMLVTAGLPDRSVVGDRILKSLARYQIFFALDQPWSMFAPNPSAVNSYLTATINFKDGSTEHWTFPRPSQMDSFDRFTSGERFRKFQQDNLIPMEKTDLWSDLAKYVSREVMKLEKQGRGREFESLEFYRHHNIVAAPTKVFVPHGTLSSKFTSENVFQFKSNQQVRHEANNNN
ncbi:hypothetical protein AZI87_02360 [Bdellovibrio bacteriovorus]|uniref:Uncharacterized protein n=1 Tax=Bdellovibrio bacteriovorus TaxID=959 RepID=A0A162GH04_BDEBC|nr:hypothetical protein [Bdellovibrio bacteriovorus]KYG68123.1 hypothetical protein AZI87_02360 [Bdellovibrio bacteriovorus]